MSRRVVISVYEQQGISRMTDYSDGKLLVEIYDSEIDQEVALLDLAEGLGYSVVEEVYA